MTHYCICGEDTDPWCPEHGDEVDDLREEYGRQPPYRDGKVHVLSEKCATCIFRPGNLMSLEPGRVKGMVDGSLAENTAITCHATLYQSEVPEALCRGFVDAYGDRSPVLRMAQAMGVLEEVPPPGQN